MGDYWETNFQQKCELKEDKSTRAKLDVISQSVHTPQKIPLKGR